MGILLSCCNKKLDGYPDVLNTSLKLNRASEEDPHAPLLSKKISDFKQKESELLDADLEQFIEGLSSDDGKFLEEEETEEIIRAINAKKD